MRHKYSIVCLLIMVFACENEHIDKCIEYPLPTDTYSSYPVPGTAEWIALGSDANLYKACQLPDSLLRSISTPGLVQSLLDNPCLMFINVFSTYFKGRDVVLSRLNSSFELNKRIDGAYAFVNKYRQLSPACFPANGSSLEQGRYLGDWVKHEVIMTQDSLLNQLNHYEKVELTKILISKYDQKIRSGIDFGTSITTNMLAILQIMKLDYYAPYLNELNQNQELLIYSTTGAAYDHKAIQKITIDFAKNYVMD